MLGFIASNRRTTVNCYSFFDKVFPACGLLDYTEGLYTDARTTYEAAQENQINYVLDQVHCGRGVRLLEVGCGNGNLLDLARRRGALARGITISPEQVRFCRQRGLTVECLDYRDIDASWSGQFDAVIANGSIEHFVHPREAAAGRADAIYREMFALFHRMIDPASSIRRLINTTIHFLRPPQPHRLLQSPWLQHWFSDDFDWALLQRSFGGWYPALGQFERCAEGCFRLLHECDGTLDYQRTSEEWLRRVKALRRSRVWRKVLHDSLPFLREHPLQAFNMLVCMLGSQSWNWQFRSSQPPTRLLRQTWTWEPREVAPA